MMRYLIRFIHASCMVVALWGVAGALMPPLTAIPTLSQALGIAPAWADDSDWRNLHREVESGRMVALPTLLNWLDERYIGQVLEVELERDDGEVIYEIEMIGPQGQVVEFNFNAVSGELIAIEGVGIRDMQRPGTGQQ